MTAQDNHGAKQDGDDAAAAEIYTSGMAAEDSDQRGLNFVSGEEETPTSRDDDLATFGTSNEPTEVGVDVSKRDSLSGKATPMTNYDPNAVAARYALETEKQEKMLDDHALDKGTLAADDKGRARSYKEEYEGSIMNYIIDSDETRSTSITNPAPPVPRPVQPGAHPISGLRTNSSNSHSDGANLLVNPEDSEAPLDVEVAGNAGLVEASPVNGISQSFEVYDEEQRARASERKRKDIIKAVLCVSVGLNSLFVVVAVVLVVMFLGKDGDSPDLSSTTMAPSESLESHVRGLVHEVSSSETFSSSETPQSKALDWLLGDPSLSNYSDWRIKQRYILAVFYYGTHGPEWAVNANWLNYTVHECQWYTMKQYYPPEVENSMAVESFLSDTLRSVNDAPCGNADGDPREPSDTFKYLVLMLNDLKGTFPEELFKLTSLRGINLSANMELHGTIPTDIGLLKDMQAMHFSYNPSMGKGGTLPTQVGLLTDLADLMFVGALMTGTVPTELGLLSKLEVLMWDEENIPDTNKTTARGCHGTVPTELGNLSNLWCIYLNGQLTGTLPTELKNLHKNMKALSFWGNKLTGTIPSELGLLTALSSLHLIDNSLTGSIPSQVGALPDLARLRLSHNQLSGSIPSQLGVLTSLTQLYLSDNLLSGTVSEKLCSLGDELDGDPNDYWSFGLSFDCGFDLCGCKWCPCSNDTIAG